MYAVYILLCSDDSYYTGQSNDLEKRIWQHETGFFPDCYTLKRRPLKLVWHTIVETLEEATKLEKQIRGWSRKKKEALIRGDIEELKRLSNLKPPPELESPELESPELDEGAFIKVQADELKSIALSSSSGVDYIIIGQGICGTWLSYYLTKSGYSVLVIDDPKENSASKTAAGIINPVTGRRIVKTWMIDELLPVVHQSYTELGTALNLTAIEQKNIVDFFPTPQMKLAFNERYLKDQEYLSNPDNENHFRSSFNYDFGYGEIQPCFLINLQDILPAYRNKLQQEKNLLEENFSLNDLQVSADVVQYNGISARAIIFCDGIHSFENPYFKNLPFAPNKGEVLWIEAPDLPSSNIFKKGINIVPWSKNIFWVGSSYEWEFENDQPTEIFRERTLSVLKHWLKIPFSLLDHKASIRPATLERRPFVGFHPLHPTVGIFNGMGTKGCSLAPFFAQQLVANVSEQKPIHPEADIKRFARVLSR